MKRLLVVLCCMILSASCIALTGCGSSEPDMSDSQYVGTWVAVKAQFMEEDVDVDEVLNGDFELILNEDGTAKLVLEDEESMCSWTETDTGVKIEGDTEMQFEYNDGLLVTSALGVHFCLEKQ